MLTRCYNNGYHARYPSYIGCSVSENFRDFQFFAGWCNSQIGFSNKGWHLDKDIVFKGNRVYSEDTCFFVPRELNALFIAKKIGKGLYPTGVCFNKTQGKFQASCKKYEGGRRTIGLFNSVEEAFSAYKDFKEDVIKKHANHYRGKIHDKVYESLMNWKIVDSEGDNYEAQ